MPFTDITALLLLEMKGWVSCLPPHLAGERKTAPSACVTLVPETS